MLCRGVGSKGNKAAAPEDGPHEGVVEPAPVVVDGMSRGCEERTEAARAGSIVICKITVGTLGPEERGRDRLRGGRVGEC